MRTELFNRNGNCGGPWLLHSTIFSAFQSFTSFSTLNLPQNCRQSTKHIHPATSTVYRVGVTFPTLYTRKLELKSEYSVRGHKEGQGRIRQNHKNTQCHGNFSHGPFAKDVIYAYRSRESQA